MGSSGSVFVALLRGINVGGKNPVAMAALKQVFERLGHTDVATYIQSGNVVFRNRSANETAIASGIEQALERRFGIPIPVVLRTEAELARVASRNPFLSAREDITRLQVAFLSTKPAAEAICKLDPARSLPDVFRVVEREIYMRCPNGFARTRLTIAYFEGVLETRATARNWKTVTTLSDWATSASGA